MLGPLTLSLTKNEDRRDGASTRAYDRNDFTTKTAAKLIAKKVLECPQREDVLVSSKGGEGDMMET